MRRFYTTQKDLLFSILIMALGAGMIVAFPDLRWPLRTVLALVMVLAVPGYVASLILFPRKSDVDSVQRLALSLGLSVVSVVGIGLALNYSPWGIQTESTALGLALLVVVLSLLAWLRRLVVGEDGAFRLALGGRRLVVVLATLSVATLLLGWLTTSTHYTEFYILGSEGRLDSYPQTLSVNQEFPLTVGVSNNEARSQRYTVRAVALTVGNSLVDAPQGGGSAAGSAQLSIAPDSLPPLAVGESWEGAMTLRAPDEPGDYLLTLRLYRERDQTPYRLLSIHVTVDSDARPNLGAARRSE